MIEEKIKEIFVNIFEIESSEFNSHLSPDNLMTWDSLTHLRLIAAVEAEFKIKISISEIQKIQDVQKLFQVIETHLENNT